MDTTTIKTRLHEYIEQADDKHLEAIYVLLEKEIAPSYQYNNDTLEMLYQRREKHLKGITNSYTAEDAIAFVRSKKNG